MMKLTASLEEAFEQEQIEQKVRFWYRHWSLKTKLENNFTESSSVGLECSVWIRKVVGSSPTSPNFSLEPK